MRLAPGEQVLLELRPHGNRLALPVLVLLLLCAGAGWSLAALTGPLRLGALGGAALLAALLVLVPWLRWRSRRLVLTDARLAVRSGVLSRSGRDVPLRRVDEVLFRRTLRQRLLGRGTLLVLAGDGPPLAVRDLRRVEDVQREVWDAVDALDEPDRD